MATSLACGLEFLHENGIVHWNIRSSNVLVENANGQLNCVVIDFAYAIREQDLPINYTPGDINRDRIQPYELLQEDVNMQEVDLNVLKKSDVYSFSLVIWEMMTRTTFKFQYKDDHINQGRPYEFSPRPYKEAYSDEIAKSAPQIGPPCMKDLLIKHINRPTTYTEWLWDPIMAQVYAKMSNCWVWSPIQRPDISLLHSEFKSLK